MTWQQFLNLLDTYGPIAAVIAVLIVGILLLWKLWPFIRRAVKVIDSASTLPEELEKLHTKIDTLGTDVAAVKHEVQTNNGSSLKDAIGRSEKSIKSTQGMVRRQGGRITKLEKRVAENLGSA